MMHLAWICIRPPDSVNLRQVSSTLQWFNYFTLFNWSLEGFDGWSCPISNICIKIDLVVASNWTFFYYPNIFVMSFRLFQRKRHLRYLKRILHYPRLKNLPFAHVCFQWPRLLCPWTVWPFVRVMIRLLSVQVAALTVLNPVQWPVCLHQSRDCGRSVQCWSNEVWPHAIVVELRHQFVMQVDMVLVIRKY